MKTVVIWDTMEADIKFFVLEGDYRHLDQVYLNSCGEDQIEEKQDELNDVLAYDEHGRPKVKMLDSFPLEEKPDFVVVCGFIP